MNISKFIDETQSSQARGGDLGGEDPSVPHQPGGGHAPSDTDYVRVQEPGSLQAACGQGTRGVRESGVPSLRGHTPHAARRPHAGAGEREDPGGRHPGEARDLCHASGGHAPSNADHHGPDQGSHPPPEEADRGLWGPLDDVDGGEDGVHATSDVDIKVIDKLSESIVNLDNSVKEQSSVPSETQTGNDIRRAQYCPSWLQIQYSADSKCSEVMTSFCDSAQAVSDFNSFCWQGLGGLRLAPSLPSDLTDIKDVMPRLKSPLATPEHPKILKSTR